MQTESSKMSRGKLEALAKILKTIAHPVKLEILMHLKDEEPLDVSTLCFKIGVGCEISMMSHHLAKMKDNGLLKSDKKGKQVYYSIANRDILNLFSCMEHSQLLSQR